ncbi:MAG: lysylphosphatidylglycerol synthase domain-containing protein [Gemmatimonadota bacterium]
MEARRSGPPDGPREGRRRARFRWAVGAFLLVAFAFLLVGVLRGWGELRTLREEVADHSWRLSAGWLGAALAAWSAALLGSAAAWVWLFRRAGGRIGMRRGLLVWLSTNLGRYIPGKIWQLTGLAVHLRRRGGSGAVAVSSSLQAQLLALVVGLAVAVSLLGGGLASVGRPIWQAALLGIALLFLLHPAVIGRIGRSLHRWLREEDPPERLSFRELVPAGFFLAGVWLAYGAGFAAYLRGVGGTAIGVGQATGIFAAAYVAGYAFLLAPAGLVAREGAMTFLLLAVTPLSAAVAATLAVGARLGVTLAELVAITAGWLLAGFGERDEG